MKALYSAATGMAAQQIQIDTIANNLANVSTSGFKRTRVAFEDLAAHLELNIFPRRHVNALLNCNP